MSLKFKKMWLWLRRNVLNKNMLLPFIVAELIFWFPCIIIAILAIVYNPLYWTVFGAIIAFWAGPFTPAILVQLGLAALLKKLFYKLKRKGGRNNV